MLQCFFTLLFASQPIYGDAEASDFFPFYTAQRLDQLERLIVHQAAEMTALKRVMDQQAIELTSQTHLLREQSATITSQQRLLEEQSALLQSQTIRLHLVENALSEIVDQPCKTKSIPSNMKGKLTDHLQENTSQRVNYKQEKDLQKDISGLLFNPGSLRQRSDDFGPLEAVVNQLSQQMTSTAADLQALKTNVSQHGLLIQDARTSTYVRWGNSQCGSASELVYSGVVGGSPYSESGAAVNFLCLTLSPVFGDQTTTAAHLYGAEYETGDSFQDKDPMCAVCRTAYTTTVMIPGTNVCTPGWHPQYSGYLMAGDKIDPAATEFICVDSALQYQAHSDQDENGKVLYYTSTVCGSLPCSPYTNGRTVLCVVCSK